MLLWSWLTSLGYLLDRKCKNKWRTSKGYQFRFDSSPRGVLQIDETAFGPGGMNEGLIQATELMIALRFVAQKQIEIMMSGFNFP